MECQKSVIKRECSANFNTAEVQLLVDLVTKHKQIIENKKTDAVTNKDKENDERRKEEIHAMLIKK